MAMSAFWAGRRVLVTGAGGFLGRVVVRRLSEGGAVPITPAHRDHDMTRPDDVEKLFVDADPDMVIHLAAQVGGIGANMARPSELYVANVLMGTHILEQARKNGIEKTVLLGTICSYPKLAPVPFRESSLWDGYPEETNAPYGIAKKALLVHAQANRGEFGQNAIYLLPTNLYGPGDKFDPAVSHVIPALIKKCVEADERSEDHIVVWGTGTATREFLYVEDAARGLLLAAEHYDGPDPVNLGSGEEIAIADLAALISELTAFEGRLEWDPSKPDGQPRRRLDTSRAEEWFGFTSATPLRTGLEATIGWYRAHRSGRERQPR